MKTKLGYFFKFYVMNVLLACMYVYHVPSTLGSWKKAVDPLTGVMDDCELLCECWEFNPSPVRSYTGPSL